MSNSLLSIQGGLWLSPRSKYFKNVSSKVKKLPTGIIKGTSLHRYVAGSAPLHVLEATRYLGRAVQAFLLQDFGIAEHLAYYAELRATMGLLATEGIGVLNKCHVVLTGERIAEKISQEIGTHEFVWEAFNAWSRGTAATTLLSNTLSAWNISLGDFFDAAYPGASLKPFLQDVLQRWGIDLQTHVEDRRARNEASYRPRFSHLSLAVSPITPIDFVEQFWSLFEPTDVQPFEFIDRPLFALCYKALQSQLPARGSLANRLQVHGVAQATAIAQYVQAPQLSLPLLIKQARAKSNSESIAHTMGMLARAGLLSRLAIGSCSSLLSAAGVMSKDMNWWFQETAQTTGLVANPFIDPLDLWIDVKDALTDYAALKPISTQNELLVRNGTLVATLQQCERLSIWGMAK